jgi:hypothetical protein
MLEDNITSKFEYVLTVLVCCNANFLYSTRTQRGWKE